MAGLNRDFLMPYLQNICSLHLALRKIEQIMRKINYQIFEAENGIAVEEPRRREYVAEKDSAYYTLTVVGCAICVFCTMFMGLNILGDTRIGLPWMVSGETAGVLMLVLPQLLLRYRRKINRRIDEDYDQAYEEYRMELAEALDRSANTAAKLKLRLQEMEQQKNQADNLLQMAYAVDLIPMAYRNIYYAVYLYEWICSSRSVDLNHALRSFDMKNGKAKLEHIIVNQTDAILVHTKAVASQYRTIVMQKQQEAILQSMVAKMVCSNEQREMYSTMAEVNVAAGSFFAAADNLIQM